MYRNDFSFSMIPLFLWIFLCSFCTFSTGAIFVMFTSISKIGRNIQKEIISFNCCVYWPEKTRIIFFLFVHWCSNTMLCVFDVWLLCSFSLFFCLLVYRLDFNGFTVSTIFDCFIGFFIHITFRLNIFYSMLYSFWCTLNCGKKRIVFGLWHVLRAATENWNWNAHISIVPQ